MSPEFSITLNILKRSDSKGNSYTIRLAGQWRILRAIESRKQGATVAGLAAQEGGFPL
ncbi:MAG: hypothetical protein HWN68_00050 [Desulfobacterales bacterium]|nr:hypothetical protein [Desulfobacterales bacterium]